MMAVALLLIAFAWPLTGNEELPIDDVMFSANDVKSPADMTRLLALKAPLVVLLVSLVVILIPLVILLADVPALSMGSASRG